MKSLSDRINIAFKHHHPHRANTRGSQAWFRRALTNSDITVGAPTITKWLAEGVPSDRAKAVEEVVRRLEAEAAKLLRKGLKELGK